MGKPSGGDLFVDNSEIAALMRSHVASAKKVADGVQTPLGAVETWSSSLKSAFAILLNSCCPMFLVWDCNSIQSHSSERILLYNDASLSLLKETQHLIPLGQVNDTWTEDWSNIQANVEQVFMTGQALRCEKNPFLTAQNGDGNGPFYTWSYSAIWDETGQIRGVFATGRRVTAEIIATATVEEPCQNGQELQSDPQLLQAQMVKSSLQQAETALRESEARFQAFMSHSPTSAWIADQAGRLLYLSPTYSQMFQFPQQDVVGKQIHEIYTEEFAQQFLENNRRVFETGQVVETVETAPRPDGSTGSFLVYKFPIAQESGETLLGGVAVDITERQRTEEILRHREEEVRLITNAVPVLISFVDAEQRYRFNNQKYEEWFGESAAEMNGKYLWEVLGKAAYETIRPYVEQVLAGQEATFETRIPYKKGGIRDAAINYVPHFDQQGNVDGFVALVNDITHRKQAEETLRLSEERLRIAQQAANAGMWDWDITTNHVTWSEEYYRLYGLDPATTQSTYENWLCSIIQADRDLADQAARQALERQIDLNVEFRILHPTQGERWLTAIGQTFVDDNGRPIRMTGIALDITERKQSEAALRESETRFQAIVRNLPGMLYRYTSHPDGSDAFTYVSAGSRELLELEPETIIQDSSSIWALFHPDDLPLLRESVALVVKDLLPWQWEGRLITPSGQLKWIQGRSRPEHTEQGTVWNGLLIDITERKQVEEALRKSEERFQLIAKATNDVMWDCNLLTDEMWWSERLRIVFGYEPEEMGPNMTGWAERVHPEDAARVHTSYETCLNSGATVWTDEYCFCRADGSYADVLDRAYIIRDAAGKAVRMVGAMADITDRKQVQRELQQTLQTLQESEEWARLAIQVGRLGGWRLHLDTNLVEMDERMREIWGEPDDAVMIPLPRVIERMHPDDQVRVASAVNSAINPQSTGTYEIEYRIVWNDGTERWVLAKGQAQFAGEGESRRTVDFFGTLLDITDRKQAEIEREQLLAREQSANETLQRFIEHTPVSVVMLDREMRYLFASQNWMHEYASGYTDLKGLSYYDVMTDIPERWRQVHQRCLAGAIERCEEDYYLRTDGSTQWLYWEILPWYASGGEIGGIIIFAENITERKQAAQEREKLLAREQVARREAEQANRIKDEFLAVLSHELRSPLNPILGWAKLLQASRLDASGTKRALETIERNAKLQTQLIDDLLDVSRILRGKMIVNVCEINLVTVIDAALETVRLSAEAKNIDIHKVVSGDIRLISGDSGRLQQVVWNLLCNAVKFTPTGGQIEIQLSLVTRHSSSVTGHGSWVEERMTNDEGQTVMGHGLLVEERVTNDEERMTHDDKPVTNYAQIQVRDTGKGITPEFLPYVFECFRQEDGTTTRKFGGLGLGLAIVRYLTELHGGMVQAESPGEGQGATFTVLLPISKNEGGKPFDKMETSSAEANTFPLANLRILVVDDEADMRELSFTILKQTGAETEVVASAVAALDALDGFKPDILISDIGMPEMDGYELMRQVRSLPPERGGQILAIALTAYASEVDQQQALAAGFQRHLAKPIEPEALVRAIVTLVKS